MRRTREFASGADLYRILLIALTIAIATCASSPAYSQQAAPPKGSDSTGPQSTTPAVADTKKNYFRYRILAGYEAAIGNSAAPKGQYYFEVFATTPLNKTADRTWGFVRIAATPTQVDAPVQTFVTNLATNIANVNINQIGHSGEFMFGWEHRFPLSFSVFTVSPIAGFGGTTPINPTANVNVFTNNDAEIQNFYPSAVGKKYVAFVPPSREGVYWQYVAGARFTTLQDTESKVPESTLDLTLGQNQAITEGRFHGPVLRFDAMLNIANSLPRFSGYSLPFYVFVTGMWKTTTSRFTDSLILNPAPAGVTVPGDDVAIVTTPPSRLDLTRFGIAIDLAAVFKKNP
jgi:hypothetical protein